MRSLPILGLCAIVAATSQGQTNTKGSFASLASAPERLDVVKSSIEIPVWHEKTFWPIYEQYLAEEKEVSSESYRALYDLASMGPEAPAAEGYENALKLIRKRYDELALRKRYYVEIGGGFNGVIALQFLQTELLMDLMATSGIYEETPWQNYRFRATTMTRNQAMAARLNMMTAALSLSGESGDRFKEIYARYEEECNALLGDCYDLVGLYAGEPSDYTPALAKRLGYDLLHITERELKLKEKYFHEMNTAAGGTLAAGFLAWEDFFSVISKMHAWAEAQ